jgi:hypothetical protein
VLQDILYLCSVGHLFCFPVVKHVTKQNFSTKVTNYIADKFALSFSDCEYNIGFEAFTAVTVSSSFEIWRSTVL